LKSLHYEKVQEMNDEYNTKISQLENALLDGKERQRFHEEKAYEIIRMQEKITENWKGEHRKTVFYFEGLVKQLGEENRELREQ